MNSGGQISVAVTTYHRCEWVIECVGPILDDDRVVEVVIVDDASTAVGCWERLHDWSQTQPKTKLYRNLQNLDCHRNKRRVLELCSQPWAVLFDSDNRLTRAYIDALFAVPVWHPTTAYLPVFARPHFDYRAFAGLTVTRTNLADHLDRLNFLTALNTANYFVPVAEYLRVWDGSIDPHTADSLWQNYLWLAAGNRLYFVPGLEYEHRIHDQSHFKLNCHKTGGLARQIERKLRELR